MSEVDRQDALVVSALGSVGVSCSSIYDLVNSDRTYPAAVPVLLGLLPIVSNPRIKEGIVRALADRSARGQAEVPLLQMFRQLPPGESADGLRWVIGNSLSYLDVGKVADELIAIASDSQYGMSRQMIVSALGKIDDARAFDVLVGLLNDRSVTGHAIQALRRLGDIRAIPFIKPYAQGKDGFLRRLAQSALRSLEKRLQKA